mmetsp:Transcript_28321/g.67331  ORF Transcript_28321/g.67331 Transcript_28321/m.67331 type:complete len:205 (+) Transcript_28321:426-1040(+)
MPRAPPRAPRTCAEPPPRSPPPPIHRAGASRLSGRRTGELPAEPRTARPRPRKLCGPSGGAPLPPPGGRSPGSRGVPRGGEQLRSGTPSNAPGNRPSSAPLRGAPPKSAAPPAALPTSPAPGAPPHEPHPSLPADPAAGRRLRGPCAAPGQRAPAPPPEGGTQPCAYPPPRCAPSRARAWLPPPPAGRSGRPPLAAHPSPPSGR